MTDFSSVSTEPSLLNRSSGSLLSRARVAPALSPTQARVDGMVGTVLSTATDWRTAAALVAAPAILPRASVFASSARSLFAAEAATLTRGFAPSFGRLAPSLLALGISASVIGCGGEEYNSNVPEARSFNPVGSEFNLSAAPSTGTNQGLSLALNASGNMVAAWADVISGGTGVFARAFDSSGTPGDVTTVDTPLSSIDVRPSISTNSRGNFVVSWTNVTGPDSPSSIHARRFDDAGRPVGGILTAFPAEIRNPIPNSSVVLFEDGGFAVLADAAGRLFNADNTAAGEITLEGGEGTSAFATGVTGQGQWTWAAIVSGSSGGSTVVFQRMNGRNVTTGDSFSIGNLGTAAAIRVGTLPSGPSLIAWQTSSGIRGQMVDQDGTPMDASFSIASVPPGGSFSVSGDDRGSFVVAWEEGNLIRASVFNGEGRALFSNLDVSGSSGENREAVVAANGAGQVTIGWRRFSTSGGAHYDLAARRYQIAY